MTRRLSRFTLFPYTTLFRSGLSLDEADILRRGMSGKYRSRGEFDAIQEQIFSNCKEKGYADELTQTIWKQIESFAGRSEEHTSELQSRPHIVCRLLLEKKQF